MPCYRCGTRQVDPDRGSSAWLRGVKADRQVLICPGCQAAGEWVADLDHCHVCTSVRLFRRLGEVECRECGYVGETASLSGGGELGGSAGSGRMIGTSAGSGRMIGASSAPGGGIGASAGSGDGIVAPGLAEEVEQALAKVLRRTTRPAQTTWSAS